MRGKKRHKIEENLLRQQKTKKNKILLTNLGFV